MVRSTLVVAAVVAAVAAAGGAQPVSGWTTYSLPATGAYALRYLPATVDAAARLPAVVFLHGSGATPGDYRPVLEDAAEATGCVLVLPKSQSLAGWGDALDPVTVVAALAAVAAELELDPARVAVAGHSSGGAYAVWLAYRSGQRFSALFTLAAPFLSVAANLDPDGWVAPHRLYYGAADPNYQHGAWLAYLSQCGRLGAACELDVQAGYGHGTWPDSAMAAGLAFLVAHPRREAGWQQRDHPLDAAPPEPARGPAASDRRPGARRECGSATGAGSRPTRAVPRAQAEACAYESQRRRCAPATQATASDLPLRGHCGSAVAAIPAVRRSSSLAAAHACVVRRRRPPQLTVASSSTAAWAASAACSSSSQRAY